MIDLIITELKRNPGIRECYGNLDSLHYALISTGGYRRYEKSRVVFILFTESGIPIFVVKLYKAVTMNGQIEKEYSAQLQVYNTFSPNRLKIPRPLTLLDVNGYKVIVEEACPGKSLYRILGENPSTQKTIQIVEWANKVQNLLNERLIPSTFSGLETEVQALMTNFITVYKPIESEERLLNIHMSEYLNRQKDADIYRRFTNGDFITKNIIVTPNKGAPILIDYEFVEETHLYQLDWFRFFSYGLFTKAESIAAVSHLVSEDTTIPMAMGFWGLSNDLDSHQNSIAMWLLFLMKDMVTKMEVLPGWMKIKSREITALKMARLLEPGLPRYLELALLMRERKNDLDNDKESGMHEVKDARIKELESRIQQANSGIIISVMRRFTRLLDKFAPLGTRRRSFFSLVTSSIRIILNEGWRSFWFKSRRFISHSISRENKASFPNLYRLKRREHKFLNTTGDKPMFDGNQPSVDVVTVTYNSARFMKEFLESLATSDYPLQLMNITVVDNGSIDDTLKVVESLPITRSFGRFEVVRASRNLGYGGGVNKGAEKGDAPYILVVNPDIKLSKDCLRILVREATNDNQAWLWEPRHFPYEHPKYYDPITLETIWSSGAAFLIRREKFELLGGFDKRLFMYAEDVDLSFRIWNSGGKCRYVPSSVLWHFAYSQPGEVKPLQWYYSLRNNMLIRYKFGRMREIIKGYLLLMGLFIGSQTEIPHARRKLAKLFFSHLRLIPAMVNWRAGNDPSMFRSYHFMGWDYEVSKLGAFYENQSYTNKPLVSIVVRTKEKASYLRNALRSIANQTYRPLEVIVVEDGPATVQSVIDEFRGLPGLSLKYYPLVINQGRCCAGNEGLRQCTGTYINFLDNDDLLYPDHVEVLVKALDQGKPRQQAAYTASYEVRASYTEEEIFRKEYRQFFNIYSKFELAEKNLFPIQAVLFNRALYESLGGLDQSLDVLEDWDLWLRYSKATDFLPVEKTTSEFRVPEDSKVRAERQSKLTGAYKYVRVKNGIVGH